MPRCADALDYCNLFLITLLYHSRPSTSIGGRNDNCSRDLTHYKAHLVEVIDYYGPTNEVLGFPFRRLGLTSR